MKRALVAYVDRVGKGGDHLQGVIAASEAVAERPWDVVHLAGRLGRGRLAIAAEDFGITAALKKVKVDNVRAVVRIAKGQPHPTSDHKGRRSRGAFDTPVDMARRVVSATIRAGKTPPRIGLDPACGTGAFLVAMLEAGVPEVYGTDLDPVALAVAQVAAPKARLLIDDGLKHGPEVDMLCGNPPFVPPERQSKELRTELRRRFPWLRGRFDLVIPFAAAAAARVKSGGSIGLVLPAPALVQPYGAVLRRRWIQRHRLVDLSGPHPFPGASVKVMLVVMQIDGGPSPLPAFGISPEELLRLENVPLNADLRPGDVDLVERIRRDSVPLSSLCLVDTGLVAHGPDGGKARLLYDEPGERRVPYADARGFFTGKRVWLDYTPERMHRAKTPELFENPKVVIQRLRGRGTVRAALDLDGVYVGHTCTVVQLLEPHGNVTLDKILELVRSPIVDAITRIERGQRLDLYPRDVGAFPVPVAWVRGEEISPEEAWGLTGEELVRLASVSAR